MSAPSFRRRLALRFAAGLGVLAIVGSATTFAALRSVLLDRLDEVLVRLAAIEAAATADSPDENVHFHDDVFLSAGPGHETALTRYAEVWTLEGAPVIQSRNLAGRHLPLPPAIRTEVVAQRQPLLFTVTLEGSKFRSVLYPLGLIGPKHELHLLQVAASRAETDAVLRRAASALGGLILIGFALGGGVGWWLAGYAVRPVLDIIGQAEVMEASRPGHRIVVDAEAEELQRLVAVLNALLGRIDALLQTQRSFLADAGHAIKTPLTVLRGDVEVALRKERSSLEYREVLEQALSDLRQVSGLSEDLITLAQSDGGAVDAARDHVPVLPVLRDLARRFERAAADAQVTLEVDGDTSLAVTADTLSLERALNNLIDNAIKYSGPHTNVRVTARAIRDTVEIEVSDTGLGIPTDEQERLFQRFHRGDAGRRTASGSGLGLAIVRAIMESLGGGVEIRSRPDSGTTVILSCPAATAAAP